MFRFRCLIGAVLVITGRIDYGQGMATTAHTHPVTTPGPVLSTLITTIVSVLTHAPATAWNIVSTQTFPSVAFDGTFVMITARSATNLSTFVIITGRTWNRTFDVCYTFEYDTETDDRDVYESMGVAPIPVRRTVTERAVGITEEQLEWLVR